MKCPKCNSGTLVRVTRRIDDEIVRLRICKECKTRFYTSEKIVPFAYGADKLSEFYRIDHQKRKEEKNGNKAG